MEGVGDYISDPIATRNRPNVIPPTSSSLNNNSNKTLSTKLSRSVGMGRDTLTLPSIAERDADKSPSESQGSGQAHNNMPPYYVLTYIIKIR